MKLLLTGATGTAGKAILSRLLERGWDQLYGTCRSEPNSAFLEAFAQPLASGRLQLLRQDLAELAPDWGPEVQAVIHCAARRPLARCEADPAAAQRDNLLAVKRLAAWSRARCVKLFIHASVQGVYAEGEPPFQESDPLDGSDLQTRMKLESETLLSEILGREMRLLILRLAHFFDADIEPDGVLAAFEKGAKQGRLQLQGDGKQGVCFLGLADLSRLVESLLRCPPEAGVYNVASQTLSVATLAHLFQRCWLDAGHAEPRISIAGGAQPRSFGLDCGKLLAASGWRPEQQLLERVRLIANQAGGACSGEPGNELLRSLI